MHFDLARLKNERKELHAAMEDPDLWNNLEKAQQTNRKVRVIENKLNRYEGLLSRAEDLQTLIDLRGGRNRDGTDLLGGGRRAVAD